MRAKDLLGFAVTLCSSLGSWISVRIGLSVLLPAGA